MGSVDLNGSQTGSEITLSGDMHVPGREAVNMSITGRVTGDTLRGTLTVRGMDPIEFTARRRPGAEHEEVGR
jgi:hypothetical protein